jgi:Tol biopolymer transport system component
MRRLIAFMTVAGLSLLGLVAVTRPVQAKVPGPNGRIAFQRHDPASPDDTFVFTANPDGSDPLQLVPFHAGFPHWSPDGSEVVIAACLNPPTCNTGPIIVNPDTGTYRVLAMPDPTLFTGCSIWSPNAKRFACEGNSDADPSRNGIYTVRTSDGGGLSRITSIPGGDDIPIDYSPNGKRIVFDRTDPNGPPGRNQNQALFVVNVNGSGLRRITPWGFADDDGSWSPDGTEIVFEHIGSLYTVHPDGTHLVKLPLQTGRATTAFTAFDAGWSPDGSKIVFSLNTKTSAGGVQEGIGTANADGSDVQMITTSPTRDDKADWGTHPLAT